MFKLQFNIQIAMQNANGNSIFNLLLFKIQYCLSIGNAICKWIFNIRFDRPIWKVFLLSPIQYSNWFNSYWLNNGMADWITECQIAMFFCVIIQMKMQYAIVNFNVQSLAMRCSILFSNWQCNMQLAIQYSISPSNVKCHFSISNSIFKVIE